MKNSFSIHFFLKDSSRRFLSTLKRKKCGQRKFLISLFTDSRAVTQNLTHAFSIFNVVDDIRRKLGRTLGRELRFRKGVDILSISSQIAITFLDPIRRWKKQADEEGEPSQTFMLIAISFVSARHHSARRSNVTMAFVSIVIQCLPLRIPGLRAGRNYIFN